MRTAFITQLIEEAKKNENIFLVVADLGFSVVEPFAELFPDRFLNVGIAEQNMAGVAAGLAMEGYCVFIYSIGNFPTLRCLEQIRNDICYPKLNVKIIAVGGGFSYASLGPSHHATEEIGILRSLPNLTICAPGDPHEAQMLTTFFCNDDSPSYMRLGKAGEPNIHTKIEQKHQIIKKGDILEIINGNCENVILSTGSMLDYCYNFIVNNNIKASLFSFPFIKPMDKNTLKHIFETYKTITTIEEHQLDTGFGSSILEQLNDLIEEGEIKFESIPQIKRIGIKNIFTSFAGSQSYLRIANGISLKKIL
jgi:transketolase